MAEVDLLRALPQDQAQHPEAQGGARTRRSSPSRKQYGEMYFDGPREYGYGGYRYDGRWVPVARDIVAHFGLKPGMRVLDVGCAKGFLVKDLMLVCPGLEAFGLDISLYALMHCEPEVVGRLHLGTAEQLPFPDRSFDCVLCLNTVHNFPRPRAIKVMQEIQRMSRRPRLRAGRQLSHARAEGDLRELGADRGILRLSRRLGRAVPGGGLHRRLLLDDHRVSKTSGQRTFGMAGKTYAILGGGGSFGIHAAFYLLDHANPKKVIGIGRNPLAARAVLARHRKARRLRVSRAPRDL